MNDEVNASTLAEFFADDYAQIFAHDQWLTKYPQWLSVAKIGKDQQQQCCSAMFEEALAMDEPSRESIRKAIEPVTLADIKQLLHAYNGLTMMSLSLRDPATAIISQAQVVLDNFICFLYLKDSLFKAISNAIRGESCLRRAAVYLVSGNHKLSNFRNSVAHGSWRVDFTTSPPSFEIWDEDGTRHVISEEKWAFWRLLARSTVLAIIYGFERPSGSQPGWVRKQPDDAV